MQQPMEWHSFLSAESAPGLTELLTRFSADPFWLLLIAAGGLVYYRALRLSLRSGATRHPLWRGMLFGAGLVLVAISTLSPLEHYGNSILWVNFAGFLVLTMCAAPLLLLGSPLTLAFRVSGPSVRPRLRAIYRCRITRG